MRVTVKNRIATIRLADKIEKKKDYAEKIGVSVNLKNRISEIKKTAKR